MGQQFRIRVRGRVFLLLALWVLALPLKWVAGALAAAAVHELGHLAALWMWNVPVHEMELDLWGAVIRTGPMEDQEELCCALAGPLAGALVCLFWRWVPEVAVCAGVQSLFNLIPLYPLDGGRALLALRNICCKPGEKGVQ